jgi:hypothetical protein
MVGNKIIGRKDTTISDKEKTGASNAYQRIWLEIAGCSGCNKQFSIE